MLQVGALEVDGHIATSLARANVPQSEGGGHAHVTDHWQVLLTQHCPGPDHLSNGTSKGPVSNADESRTLIVSLTNSLYFFFGLTAQANS